MHLALPRGSGGAGGLGGGPEYAPEIGVAVSHCAAVGGGCWDDVDHACGRQEQAVGVAVAGALPCPRNRWVAARCNPSWTQASPDGGSDCRGGGEDVAREAPGSHALEHRRMAHAMGLSHTSVKRIWNAHGLKPHLTRGFKLSNDKQFVDKVQDVVGLYLNPPDKALVLSVDEK